MNNTQSTFRQVCSEIAFFLHMPVCFFWAALFFIPTSIWPARVAVHFYFILSMVAIETIFGLLFYSLSGRFDLICPITILMQWLRGYRLGDPRTYKHTFIVELFMRLNIQCRKKTIGVLIMASVMVVICQYFFGFPFV